MRTVGTSLRAALSFGLMVFLVCSAAGGWLSAQEGHTRSKAPERTWPFGKAAQKGPAGRFAKRDLFNLGILGAKAWDADRKEPGPRGGGMRRFASSARPAKDEGPKRLVIRALFPGGPAERSGLRLGDIVIGVGRKPFRKGSFTPLAKALVRAECSSRKPELTLLLSRDGKKQSLVVPLPKAGREFLKPSRGKARSALHRRALDWLQQHQLESGGFPQTLGGNNGAVVMSALAGLAWLSEGSSSKKGRYAKAIAKARDFVRKGLRAKDPFKDRMPAGASWDQSNWAFGHAGIFFGELWKRAPDDELVKSLEFVAGTLAQRQEASGGYAHGPGGKNALGYLELNIMAGFVLSSLGAAKQAGCEVDGKVGLRLLEYLEASSSGGGVGYSTKPGQQGQGNIGRTAGAWLGALSLGLRRKKFPKRMQAWTKQHLTAILDGHATLLQHRLLAGVAAAALGKKDYQRYLKAMERDLILARAPDGSFQARPWHESLLMESNTDVSLGEVWSTAIWAIVLGAGPQSTGNGGLPGWTSRG